QEDREQEARVHREVARERDGHAIAGGQAGERGEDEQRQEADRREHERALAERRGGRRRETGAQPELPARPAFLERELVVHAAHAFVSGDARSIRGSPTRIRCEKSSAIPAALAFSVMSLFARSSSKGMLRSSEPRSYRSSGRCPFRNRRQSSGTAPPLWIT